MSAAPLHRHPFSPTAQDASHEASDVMTSSLLQYYHAIEKASQDMLKAARQGDWDQVLKLEGACALLISQLKQNANGRPMGEDEAQFKARIMQRILVNDAEIRQLAEPWLDDLDDLLAGRPKMIH